MKKPHWLRLWKYRLDYFRRYVRVFGVAGAARAIHKTHMGSAKGEIVCMRLPGFKSEVAMRYGTSDIAIFEQIFVWKEYAMPVGHPVENILDCGGNIGLSAVWFASTHPAAKVIAIEPDPENYKLLCRNTGAYANIVPVQCAVWNRRCRLRVENPEDQPHSYRFAECAPDASEGVEACDLETIRKTYQLENLDIVKMDIEGAEAEVFSENFAGWLEATRMLLIEFHGDETRRAVSAALSRFRWRHFVLGENDCFVKEEGGEGYG